MKMRVLAAASAFAFAVAATPATAAPELVTNGGFDTGDFTGFTQGGNTSFTGIGYYGPPYYNVAYFGPQNTPGSIQQTIATMAGQLYNFSFDLQNDGGNPNSANVSFGGTNVLSLTDASSFGFTHYSFNVAATSANTALNFAFQQNPAYFRLDNISVMAIAGGVPEPATWGLMILGFGAAGFAMRRRNAVRASVRFA